MRNVLSIVVLAASFAVLVPDNNGARAVNAAQTAGPVAAASGHGVVGAPAVAESAAQQTGPSHSPDVTWLLALGFLGAVMARRLRVD